MDLQNDRSAVQNLKNLNRRFRIQITSRGFEIDFFWKTTGVLEINESSTSEADCVNVPENCLSVVSVVDPGNSSGECRLQVLSLGRVTELEWKNSSVSPMKGICVAIFTTGREQLSSFTKILERFEACLVNDQVKTSVHNKNKGVIEACRPDSEECQELQRS